MQRPGSVWCAGGVGRGTVAGRTGMEEEAGGDKVMEGWVGWQLQAKGMIWLLFGDGKLWESFD